LRGWLATGGSAAVVAGFSTYPRDTRRAAQVRRMLTIFTLFAAAAMLAAGCAGDDTGGAASGG
jgi:hypothetical protein